MDFKYRRENIAVQLLSSLMADNGLLQDDYHWAIRWVFEMADEIIQKSENDQKERNLKLEPTPTPSNGKPLQND